MNNVRLYISFLAAYNCKTSYKSMRKIDLPASTPGWAKKELARSSCFGFMMYTSWWSSVLSESSSTSKGSITSTSLSGRFTGSMIVCNGTPLNQFNPFNSEARQEVCFPTNLITSTRLGGLSLCVKLGEGRCIFSLLKGSMNDSVGYSELKVSDSISLN